MSLCKVICKTIQYVPIMGVLTPVIWGCLWAPNMGMKSAYEAEENVTCLAPGDTSKEPMEAWEKQVVSANFKGLWELPEFLGPECILYLAVTKLAESDPLQTHRVCGS